MVVSGQNCQLPILTSFSEPTKSSVQFQWLDFNATVVGYEIEFGVKGFTPDLNADITGITDKFFRLSLIHI